MKKLALLIKLRRYSLALYIPLAILARRTKRQGSLTTWHGRRLRMRECLINVQNAAQAA
ncbi:MAG: hypothetical protein HY547_08715 [Elusimicrobia bacterium]|nr:hypothetical protein [Elusimicrobiota bacterium]